MRTQSKSGSEDKTQQIAAALAEKIRAQKPAQSAFIQLSGPLGAGKSAFARGFIKKWLSLAGDPCEGPLISPTYNLVQLYGKSSPIAHFDLYRLHSLEELEQLGFEQYFYETPCCLVEWLEQIPEAESLRPTQAIIVTFEIEGPQDRIITIEAP